MTTFIQPPFWAQGYGRLLTGRSAPIHVGVQFLDVAPIVDPITLADAKSFLRVTIPDEDADITRFITAARSFCEQRTHRPIVAHTCDVFYDRTLNPFGWITLPFAPVQAVTSVTTTDITGLATVVDPATYLVDLASEPARIGLPTAVFWPFPLRAFQAIAVRLVLGYDQPPEDLLQAMRLMLGHFYENRVAATDAVRGTAQSLPLGVDELLAPYELVMVA
jgi:uncharacterized phiE125 gp8 family phage protein